MAGSPWGAIQHSQILKRGMRIVSTAGHGGIMVTLNSAKKNLSDEAIKRGFKYGNYLCYEEDCDMSIPIFENPDIWDKFGDEAEQNALNSLSSWNGEYLIERGVEPVKENYESYLKYKERDRLSEAQSPDLIIAAQSIELDDVVMVHTADELIHFVEKDSYRNQDRTLKLLSKCRIVEIENLKK